MTTGLGMYVSSSRLFLLVLCAYIQNGVLLRVYHVGELIGTTAREASKWHSGHNQHMLGDCCPSVRKLQLCCLQHMQLPQHVAMHAEQEKAVQGLNVEQEKSGEEKKRGYTVRKSRPGQLLP